MDVLAKSPAKTPAVLHPQLRRVFVEHVAFELRGKIIGDGEVYRACAKVLRESGMFDPPELESGRMPRISKYVYGSDPSGRPKIEEVPVFAALTWR